MTVEARNDRGTIDAAHRVRPLQQGELDGLCGLYAVVNALRLLLADQAKLAGMQIDALFHHGLAVVEARGQLAAAVNYGVSQSLWQRVIRQICREAARSGGMGVRWVVPFAKQRRPGRRRLFAVIEAAIDQQSPVLVALSGTHSHYTVICGYSPSRFVLFDSGGRHWLDRAGCGPRPGSREWRHRISTRSLTILGLVGC